MKKYFDEILKGINKEQITKTMDDCLEIAVSDKLIVSVEKQDNKKIVFRVFSGTFDHVTASEKEEIKIIIDWESSLNPKLPMGIYVWRNKDYIAGITQEATDYKVTTKENGVYHTNKETFLGTDSLNDYMGIILGAINGISSMDFQDRTKGLVILGDALRLAIYDFLAYCVECKSEYINYYEQYIISTTEQRDKALAAVTIFDDIIEDTKRKISILKGEDVTKK